MKQLKKYASILLLLTMLAGFTSCEDDETIFDRIADHSWVGDLGFSDGPYDLESGVYLGSDGFGEDELYYYDAFDGEFFGRLNIQWKIEDGTLYISYGNVAPPRELRNVYVDRSTMSGTLYIDGRYFGDVVLYKN